MEHNTSRVIGRRKAPRPLLRKFRRTWGLSGKELTAILGLRVHAQVSKIEHGKRPPKIEEALACQVLFGIAPAEMFPDIYSRIEDRVMGNIAERHSALADSITLAGIRKRELFQAALKRALAREDNADEV